jgi:hypothetical protein
MGETETSGLTDGPEVPSEEQQEYGEKRADSTQRLKAAVAEVEARVAVIAAHIVASADSNPKNNCEQQGEGGDKIKEGVRNAASVEAIRPGLDHGGETRQRSGDDGEPREQMACERKMIVVPDQDQRIRGDKGHGDEHGGPDIQMDRATVGLIVLIDGEIASGRGPKLSPPKQGYVQQAEYEDDGIKDHPEQRWRHAGVHADGLGNIAPDVLLGGAAGCFAGIGVDHRCRLLLIA